MGPWALNHWTFWVGLIQESQHHRNIHKENALVEGNMTSGALEIAFWWHWRIGVWYLGYHWAQSEYFNVTLRCRKHDLLPRATTYHKVICAKLLSICPLPEIRSNQLWNLDCCFRSWLSNTGTRCRYMSNADVSSCSSMRSWCRFCGVWEQWFLGAGDSDFRDFQAKRSRFLAAWNSFWLSKLWSYNPNHSSFPFSETQWQVTHWILLSQGSGCSPQAVGAGGGQR